MELYPITIPGGSDTYVQYNNGGIFGGIAGCVLNDATGVLTATGLTATNCAVLGSDSAVFQPNADSTTFFQIKDAGGTVFLLGDTTNKQIEISNGGQLVIDSTVATGLDMSGGTFANYSIALPANPRMSAGGVPFLYIDDTNFNFGIGNSNLINLTSGTNNFTAGYRAGDQITEGNYNFLAGANAGGKITTADSCIGIGTNALFEKTTGNPCVGIGNNALATITTSGNAVAIGPGCARYHTQGALVAIGPSAADNRGGYNNTIIGQNAGRYGEGYDCVLIGREAGEGVSGSNRGDDVVAVGYKAAHIATTADNLTLLGSYAGAYITTQGNRVIIDGLDRANAANEITDTLIYGVLDATPTSQSLRINGSLSVMEKSGMTPIGGFAIKLTNKTGGNTVAGQLVIPSNPGGADTDDAFETATGSDENVIGIVLDAGVSDGSEAWIVISGIADVLMDGGGSTRGDRIISSGTAGSADVWNVGGAVATHFLEIGHCIETRVGAGLARCVLHFN
jgi:hypothetical protein